MNIEIIKELCQSAFEVEDISLRSSKRTLVVKRWCFFALCQRFTARSLTDIAESVGMDHASVIHSNKNLKSSLMYEKEINETFKSLFSEIELITSSESFIVEKVDLAKAIIK